MQVLFLLDYDCDGVAHKAGSIVKLDIPLARALIACKVVEQSIAPRPKSLNKTKKIKHG